MFVPGDRSRRAFHSELERTYVVTLLGVWTVVLLWVWMAAPLLAHGVWPLLDSPQTSTGRKAPEKERDLFVSVVAGGQLFLDEKPVTSAALERSLRAVTTSQEIFVRVDKAAPFGAVRAVVRAAQRANQRHLIFLARPRESELSAVWE